MIQSNNKDHHLLSMKVMQGDHCSCIKAVNLHTGLVQEFFHKRTEAWLNIVGKKLFKIKQYWAAFEFASGCGQIHTHLLAITSDQHSRLKEYYMLRHDDDCYNKRVKLMSSYARNELQMTVNHHGLYYIHHNDCVDTDRTSISKDECKHWR